MKYGQADADAAERVLAVGATAARSSTTAAGGREQSGFSALAAASGKSRDGILLARSCLAKRADDLAGKVRKEADERRYVAGSFMRTLHRTK